VNDLHFWQSQNADRREKNGFLTIFLYEVFRSVYINACAFDIFWLLVGWFDEVQALPQLAFRVLPGILVSFQVIVASATDTCNKNVSLINVLWQRKIER
jgi:hypothetical protein